MKQLFLLLVLVIIIGGIVVAQVKKKIALQVKTEQGILEGVYVSGIRSFKGVPFAAPPVGDLRWREPQPVKSWTGVRKADKFGPRAMQRPLFDDMQFRSDGVSEDCLYLNVWTPAKTGKEKLPVLVYFYGGGLMAGDGSEYRYDGENMARQGMVAISVNYRLSVFGFFAHPELTKESPHKASGNYGFMDQAAALLWVKQNIAAFGGDPGRVTIAGESAGSFSVYAQMASPISKHLIAGAIGESGSLVGRAVTLKDAEERGQKFAGIAGAKSLADLRKMTAAQVLDYSANHEWELFPVNIDGYFFPKSPDLVFAAGEQSKVPQIVGWNSEEGHYSNVFGDKEPNEADYKAALEKTFGDKAGEFWKYYGGTTVAAMKQGATDLSSDNFIGYGTWKWADMQSQTGGKPVYRYFYTHPRPPIKGEKQTGQAATGASHSAEIEYAMGNLSTNKFFDWKADDYAVSEIIQGFFVNFIKTGNPNGLGLPEWPTVKPGVPAEVMVIGVDSHAETEQHRDRYLFRDKLH